MSRVITEVVSDRSFLEAPRWHEGRIWFSDFYTREVVSARADGSGMRIEARVDQQPSGMGWLPDGRLLVVSMRDQRVLRRENDGTLVTHADLSGHAVGHLNDMVVDGAGRAYVGDFGFDMMGGAPFRTARLMRVDPDGSVAVAAEDVWFPNGMVIDEDNTLRVGESFGNGVLAFDIAADGSLTNRRAWATFGERPTGSTLEEFMSQLAIAPDGSCLDAEGAMWIADALGGRAVRVRAGGEIVDEVSPGTNVFACMLGGDDGRTLFLCAAPDFLEANRKDARDGQLLSVRVDVPHAGLP